MKTSTYFASLGYKWADSQSDFIIKDFQHHAGLKDDGVIGPLTKAKMDYYNHSNFCIEVFKPIKPYIPYNDVEIEALMQSNLKGLGAVFNRCAKDNDFDVLHAIAHAVLESSDKGLWANSAIAKKKNNIFGFGAYDLSPMASAKKFSSFAECIQIWSAWFNENYLEPWGCYYHGNCEKGVNFKYASSGIAGINKSFIVGKLKKQLGR
jgi:beta-N-acetylglucosaminidase